MLIVWIFFFLWARRGLNPRPPDYESVALTYWATSPTLFAFIEAKSQRLQNFQSCLRRGVYYRVSTLILHLCLQWFGCESYHSCSMFQPQSMSIFLLPYKMVIFVLRCKYTNFFWDYQIFWLLFFKFVKNFAIHPSNSH